METKIKLSVKFQGRQMNHPEFGHNLIAKVKTDLQDFGTPEGGAINRRVNAYILLPLLKKAE